MTAQIGVDFVANTASWDSGVKRAADTLKSQSAQMSGALSKLDGDMAGFGKTSVQAAGQTQQIQSAMRNLVAVQIQAKTSQQELRTAYRQGAIGLEEYKLRQLEVSTAVRLARGEYSQSLATIGRTNAVARGSSQAFRQIGFQLSDVATQFATGTRAAIIFAEQGPQIVQAMTLGSNATKGFAGFMAGPWGAAILTGVSVVGALVAMLTRSSSEADNAKKSMETLADKLDRTKHSFEDVTKALREYNAEQKKSKETTLESANAAGEAAKKNIKEAISIREKIKANLAYLSSTGPFPSEEAERERQLTIANLGSKLAANDAELLRLAQDAQDAAHGLADVKAEMRADPATQIKEHFAELAKQAHNTIRPMDQLIAKLAELKKEEKAALDAIKTTASTAETSAFMAPVHGQITGFFNEQRPGHKHAGVDIAVPAGTAVRAPAAGVVIEAGSLPGYGNVVFIDHGGGTISRLAHLSKLSVAKGATIEQGAIVGLSGGARGEPGSGNSTGPHLHYEVRVGGKPVDPRKANFPVDTLGMEEKGAQLRQQMEAKALQAREEAIRRQKAFDDATNTLDAQILEFKRSTTTDIGEIAQYARDQVQAESDKFTADVMAKEQLGDLTKLQGDELLIKHAILSALKAKQVSDEAAAQHAKEALDSQFAANDNQRDILNAQDRLATTAAERREIALRLLGYDEQEERLRLQNIIYLASINKATAQQAKDAQDRLNQLPLIYGLRVQGTIQANAGPLATYIQGIPKTAGEINLKVEGLMVDELEAVRRGIDDAITNALGIKDPMLAGLIDLFIQEVLIRPIAEALEKARAAQSGGGGIGGLFSMIGGLFGGGGTGSVFGGLASSLGGEALAGGFAADAASLIPAFTLGFGGGGYTGDGPRNQIAGAAHRGEFYFDAPAVARIGVGKLEMMRRGLNPANNNVPVQAGDVHFHLPSVSNKRDARETKSQLASAARQKIGMNAKRGLA